MQRGAAQRAVGSTRLNEISSRSHAVFMIITENVTIHAAEGEQSPACAASLPSPALPRKKL